MHTIFYNYLFCALQTGRETSMHLNDPESTSTLARALQVQSCELIGQFLVMLRNLSTKFCQLLKQEQVVETANKSAHEVGWYTTAIQTSKKVSTQNCILMLCRLAWLLQSPSGSFLNDALQVNSRSMSGKYPPCNDKTGMSNGAPPYRHVNSTAQYMTTTEQLQSAFDIADTDGDGLVTFDEAVEVV